MKGISITLNRVLLFSLLTIVTSCRGQNAAPQSTLAIGDTVSEIDKSIWGIFQDKNNTFWFGSNGQGVYRYDGKTIVHYTTKHGLCNNRIWKIEGDKSGNIYFTTANGICKFDGQTFTTLHSINHPTNGWKLEPDDLWFKGAQDSGTVYRYDGKSLYRLEFPKTKLGEDYLAQHPRSLYPNMAFSPYDVYSIYKDRKGNIWFGGAVLGVCRYDGKSVTWISENDVTELDDGPANGVRSIIEDKDGYFWFSNTQYRYNVYGSNSPENDRNAVMNYKREKAIGPLDGDLDFYMSIAKDNNDELWMATYASGVWRYDGKNVTHYPISDGNTPITLFSIYKDNQGVLWLGTHEAGAYRFNGKTFEKFTP